jgi:hypothetical protein
MVQRKTEEKERFPFKLRKLLWCTVEERTVSLIANRFKRGEVPCISGKVTDV